MANRDGNPDTAIIGRDTDAGARDGSDVADQLGHTTSEDAGGNVSGTAAEDADSSLDILSEGEGDDNTRH